MTMIMSSFSAVIRTCQIGKETLGKPKGVSHNLKTLVRENNPLTSRGNDF